MRSNTGSLEPALDLSDNEENHRPELKRLKRRDHQVMAANEAEINDPNQLAASPDVQDLGVYNSDDEPPALNNAPNEWMSKVTHTLFNHHYDTRKLFSELKKEWVFTGETTDLKREGEEEGDCELCGHEKLRYHFEIKNTQNDQRLYIGSDCIRQFKEEGLQVLNDDKQPLSPNSSRLFIENKVQTAQKDGQDYDKYIRKMFRK